MKPTKILAFVALCFLITNAQAVNLQTHYIEIEINNLGFANVTEKYTLRFVSPFEEESFKEQAKQNSSSIQSWSADYEFFYPRFGEIASKIVQIEKSSVSYEEESKTIVLNYTLADNFAQITQEEPRQIVWQVPGRKLAAFESHGLIVVNESTTIKIILPQNAQLISFEPKSGLKIENNTATISGISTSTFKLDYSVQKPLSQTVNILERLSEVASNTPISLTIALILVISLAAFFKRKAIQNKIEDYIVKHSEINPGEQQEDLDLED